MYKYLFLSVLSMAILFTFIRYTEITQADRILNKGYIECMESSLGSTVKGWTIKDACNAYKRSKD